MALRTDYKDFVPPETGRAFQIIDKGDGTSTITDVTVYEQEGDYFTSSVINATNTEVAAKESLLKNAAVKAALVDADSIAIVDSAASSITKRITWASIKTLISNIITAGTAAIAVRLQTARTIRTNLASTSTANFDGTANITPGVTGTLPIGNGGTAATTAPAALTSLGAMPKAGGTFTGKAYAQNNTDYTTYQIHNIAFAQGALPSSGINGQIVCVW